jgi:nucleoside-triphosphatase THEP1
MPDKKIYILIGAVQTGKTTRLLQWSSEKKNVFGILTPVVEGKRIFMDTHTREQFRMEAEPEEKNTLSIGKFIFSKNSFEKAINILKKSMKEAEGWFVIDEIGPLELRGEGFNTIIKNILASDTDLKILFVIRDSIVDKAIEYYDLGNDKIAIINKDDLVFGK